MTTPKSFPRHRRHAALLLTVAAGWMHGCGDETPATMNSVDAGPVYNGCTAAMFVDRTAASAARTVGFGGAEGSGALAYAPRCMTVSAGQTVTFTGSGPSAFGGHPLSPGVVSNGSTPANPMGGSPGNPIPRTTAGQMITVTFPTAGLYPYDCELHEPSMSGVILVR